MCESCQDSRSATAMASATGSITHHRCGDWVGSCLIFLDRTAGEPWNVVTAPRSISWISESRIKLNPAMNT